MVCLKNSREGAEILMDYCARKLDPDRVSEIDGHLAGCAFTRFRHSAQPARCPSISDTRSGSSVGDRRASCRLRGMPEPGERAAGKMPVDLRHSIRVEFPGAVVHQDLSAFP